MIQKGKLMLENNEQILKTEFPTSRHNINIVGSQFIFSLRDPLTKRSISRLDKFNVNLSAWGRYRQMKAGPVALTNVSMLLKPRIRGILIGTSHSETNR